MVDLLVGVQMIRISRPTSASQAPGCSLTQPPNPSPHPSTSLHIAAHNVRQHNVDWTHRRRSTRHGHVVVVRRRFVHRVSDFFVVLSVRQSAAAECGRGKCGACMHATRTTKTTQSYGWWGGASSRCRQKKHSRAASAAAGQIVKATRTAQLHCTALAPLLSPHSAPLRLLLPCLTICSRVTD